MVGDDAGDPAPEYAAVEGKGLKGCDGGGLRRQHLRVVREFRDNGR